jgi:hypothetical protein
MSRRNAFNNLKNESVPAQNMDQLNGSEIAQGNAPLDFIPTAQPRKKRNRNWEKRHKSEVATYRGISKEIVDMVQRFADILAVPRDEILRAFLEYGLKQYQNGNLKIFAFPKAQRMTLYPIFGQQADKQKLDLKKTNNWLTESYPVAENGKKKMNIKQKQESNTEPSQWQTRVTFRLPPIVKEEVRNIALEHSVPVGEIVCHFVMEASKAYRDGKLVLQPVPKITSKTLFRNNEETYS